MPVSNLWKFFGLTYLISWCLFAALYFGAGLKTGTEFITLVFFFMWGPACSALICCKAFRGSWLGGINLAPRINLSTFGAMFAPLALLGIAFYISKMIGLNVKPYHLAIMDETNIIPTPGYYIIFVFLFVIVGVINGIFSISEELGFRGYALSEALPKYGFWKTSAIIGCLWGLWHTPLILAGYNYPGHPVKGILMITAVTMSITPLINYLTLKSGHIWSACFFHGVFNFLAPISILMIGEAGFPHMGMIGLGGIISGTFSALVLRVLKSKEIAELSYTPVKISDVAPLRAAE